MRNREEFEKQYAGSNLTKTSFGYVDENVQEVWLAWQACAERKGKRINELKSENVALKAKFAELEKQPPTGYCVNGAYEFLIEKPRFGRFA